MTAKAHRNEPTTILHTPGQLLANIPGILGFYPSESIVFACMFNEGEETTLTLGPVMRLDIGDIRLLPDVAKAMDSFKPTLIFAFIISKALPPHVLDDTLDQLYESAERGTINITGCWYTKEIISSEPYMLCFGPEPEALEADDHGISEWEYGRISPITSAVATKRMLQEGQLPELSRFEAYALFEQKNPHLSAARLKKMKKEAYELAETIEHKINADDSGQHFLTSLDVFTHALEFVKANYFDASSGAENFDELLKETDILHTAATYMSKSFLRDAILHLCVDFPRESALLLRATACTFNGELRSNALSLYALSVIAMGLAMKAAPALEVSIQTTPRHNLSNLLREGLFNGQSTKLIDACLRGNQQLRDYHVPASVTEVNDESKPQS
ncbi:hypothetical protein N24_1993 [Corynebacterium suranareeae]|uniref:DUF4192 domain-containing protein n=1 Tax=Corynebacterium suranareeae TaxID=2506452 RepID=A0A160PRP9_9CORY|nr:DUF4192 domain-containing protein [Corynebacterium suranareeae]BAU96255.1 hypothetical protein N24_1993 [Corynebacterium suranareeae]